MKVLFHFLLTCLIISGCRNDRSQYVLNSLDEIHEAMDTTHYPLIIEGGTRIVYQTGHMSPDKGLKLYFDTIPYPAQGWSLDESVRRQLSAATLQER